MVHHLLTKEQVEKNDFKAPYLELFTSSTPNGYKITILLELLKLDYYVYSLDIMKGECKQDWFLKINSNGKVPALKDVSEDGESILISESAAILLYIVDKYDKENKYSFTPGTKEYYEMHELIYFQMSGLGPMKGQYFWFSYFAPEKSEMAINKFHDETIRIYAVLEEKLKNNGTGYLVGDHLSLADIITYPWITGITRLPETDNYPNILAWTKKLDQIPEFVQGCKIPENTLKFD